MICDTCKQHIGVLKPHGWLEIQAPGGRLKIHTICETCLGKLENFLRLLGWRLVPPSDATTGVAYGLDLGITHADKPDEPKHFWRCSGCGQFIPWDYAHSCSIHHGGFSLSGGAGGSESA